MLKNCDNINLMMSCNFVIHITIGRSIHLHISNKNLEWKDLVMNKNIIITCAKVYLKIETKKNNFCAYYRLT